MLTDLYDLSVRTASKLQGIQIQIRTNEKGCEPKYQWYFYHNSSSRCTLSKLRSENWLVNILYFKSSADTK